MQIAVGTLNQAKVKAVENVFPDAEVISCDVSSNVSKQPFSDEETIRGAINRAKNALRKINADLGIGLEGGVTETAYGLMLCNWGALVLRGGDEPIIAGGARILLPPAVAARLRKGQELGSVMDDFCKRENIRIHEGAIGIFTNGEIDRSGMYTHIVKMLKGQSDYRLRAKNKSVGN